MRASRGSFRQLISNTRIQTPISSHRALCTTSRPSFTSPPSQHLKPLLLSSLQSVQRPRTQRFSSTLDEPPPPFTESQKINRPARHHSYELTFTCKPCQLRSSHRITKHGYHRGTVVVTCPGCRNRHIISDHLKIFMDEPTDIEGIMAKHGERVKKGVLGKGDEGQDIEFWDDGTETVRESEERLKEEEEEESTAQTRS